MKYQISFHVENKEKFSEMNFVFLKFSVFFSLAAVHMAQYNGV